MQPALAGLGGHGLQAARQIVRFGARDDRVPDRIGACGKALEAVGRHVQHLGVVALELVARVAQHQGAARWWRQEFLDALEAVLMQHGHLAACFELCNVARQRAHVGGMQLEDLELVALLHAQQGLDDEGRARIVAQLRALVEGAHRGQVGLQHRGQLGLLGLGQAQDAVGGLAALVGVVAIQAVQAGAGVRVQHREGGLLLEEVLQGGYQHGVLEHIGVVACMEGVAVTEHRRMVTSRAAGWLSVAAEGWGPAPKPARRERGWRRPAVFV